MSPPKAAVGLDILGQDGIGIGVEGIAESDDRIQSRKKCPTFYAADAVGSAAA